MKCVATQYLATFRYFKRNKITLKRTTHLTFVADEEIGGVDGMLAFVRSGGIDKLNVGCCLDEGMASPNEIFNVYYAERPIWRKII